jgi:predicted outer membrane repeat protein
MLMRRATFAITALLVASLGFVSLPGPVRAASDQPGPNNIYVGINVNDSAESSCVDPDFSLDDEYIQDALTLAFDDVNDDGDVIIICEGFYDYGESLDQIDEYDGSAEGSHPVITIRAEEGAEVVLEGRDNNRQLLRFNNTDVTIAGIIFSESGGSAISVMSGDGIHSLTVEDAEFYLGNAANGSAIYAENMDLTVTGSIFGAAENDAATPYAEGPGISSNSGGAIFATGFDLPRAARISISNSTFTSNTAQQGNGGAIMVEYETRLTVSGSTFTANSAEEYVGERSSYGCGGAIYLRNEFGAQITNTMFTENSADFTGGAIASQSSPETCAGDPDVYARSLLEVRSSTFRENTAVCAGGAIESLALRVSSSLFDGNNAEGCAGGAIAVPGMLPGTPFELLNNRFIDNVLDNPEGTSCCDGGAVYLAYDNESGAGATPLIKGNSFLRNSSDTFGGALNLFGPMSVRGISRNTFQGNVAVRGGGISLTQNCDAQPASRRVASDLLRANRFRANRADSRREADLFRSPEYRCEPAG